MALPHTLTLAQLNQASLDDAAALLDGLYEHSPWIARAALTKRPFQTLAALKHAMVQVVSTAPIDTQLALIRAHPELAGKAMVAGQLTPESDNEQQKAGLTLCTAQDLEIIQQLNRDYQTRFGFPFILAVRGPRGTGLSKEDIIATYQRRLIEHPDFELQECLRNIHRIVELRLNDKFGATPHAGHAVWDWQEALAQYSDNSADLTVTYLTDAHRACAQRIRADMLSCGCDEVTIDAVGNVVGRYHGSQPGTLALMTGSHFDTVRNAGKYDGRLGIYVPLACVRALHQQGKRLPFGLEIIGFSEEEGQRFKATFLGSGALTGDFNPEWLTQKDAAGMSMAQAMAHAGLQVADISAIQRDPARYLGFVEVHIEQGPVLNELNLPLGIVTSINAVVRYQVEAIGTASHAGTTPMNRRRRYLMALST
jgi:beta-ureidopropionase / N-carbamoyl-L-amino-acid hydrolase